MSHQSQHSTIGQSPREISTRNSMAGFAGTLDALNDRLNDLIGTHWGTQPSPGGLKGDAPADNTHPGWIAHLERTIGSISDKIEFISARL